MFRTVVPSGMVLERGICTIEIHHLCFCGEPHFLRHRLGVQTGYSVDLLCYYYILYSQEERFLPLR
jgi:hypothetical protein